jgi:hypothetical protein
MPIFQLVLQTSADSTPETLQFIAANVSGALTFANQHGSALPAELWEGGALVCKLEYSEQAGSWFVADQDARAATS